MFISIVYSLKDTSNVLKITASRVTANTAKYIQNNIDHPNVNKVINVKTVYSKKYTIVDDQTSYYEQPLMFYDLFFVPKSGPCCV